MTNKLYTGLGAATGLVLALLVTPVHSQNPALVFGSSSGAAQVIKSTSNALWVSVQGILAAANGGTGNGFTAFTGPASTTKTFTLPNATSTILTSNAAVTFGQGGTGLASAADDTVMVSSGSAWVAAAVANCTDTGGNHLNYTASTNAFSCGTSGASSGNALLDGSAHTDTAAGSVTRGDIVYGNSTPKWARLAIGTSGYVLQSGASDVAWFNLFGTANVFTTVQTVNRALAAGSRMIFKVSNSTTQPSGTISFTASNDTEFASFGVDWQKGDGFEFNGGAAGATTVFYITRVDGQLVTGGTLPTITSGFGSSPSIVGGQAAGRVTVGTGGVAVTGLIAFNSTWAHAPMCVANDETGATVLPVQATATTTTLTLSSTTAWGAADKLTYHCIGY